MNAARIPKRTSSINVLLLFLIFFAPAVSGENIKLNDVLIQAAREKATQNGLNPIPLYVDENGEVAIVPGTLFSMRDGSWVPVDGDMLINVGKRPAQIEDSVLGRGEYAIVQNGRVEKQPDSLMPYIEKPSHAERKPQSRHDSVGMGTTLTNIELVGRITNFPTVAKYMTDDSYFQIVDISNKDALDGRFDDQGRIEIHSTLPRLEVSRHGSFGGNFISIKPGKYIIVPQLFDSGVYQTSNLVVVNAKAVIVPEEMKTLLLRKSDDSSLAVISVRKDCEQEVLVDMGEMILPVAEADGQTSSKVREDRMGIWADSAGSFGKLKGTNINVYLATADDFSRYQKTKQFEMKPVGLVPLFLDHVRPGRHYVGFEMIMDKNIIKPESYRVTSPFPSQGIRIKPEKYFAQDVPSLSEYGLKVVSINGSKSAQYYFRKWYVVNVEEDRIQPVVSLFVKKNAPISDLFQVYPQNEHFKIDHTKESLGHFWNSMEEFGFKTTADQQNKIIDLLKRGGVVPLPTGSAFQAICVNAEGKLLAKATIEDSSGVKTLEPLFAESKSSKTLPKLKDATFKEQAKQLLPAFESPLLGSNEVRVKNPNDFNVIAGVRLGDSGKDFQIGARGSASIYVPNGHYQIYFVYSNKPDELYRGENFSLSNNGVEIEIVKIVGGNYAIRRVE